MGASTPRAYANWQEKQKMKQTGSTDGATPGVGHNSQKFAKDQLKSFVERIEKLEEEKSAIADDIRDVVSEAKASGFDAKALRAIIRERKQDPDERAEHAAIVDTYRDALGMLG